MTNKEWLACDDPACMLEFLDPKNRRKSVLTRDEWKRVRQPGARTLRLFAAACCRRVWSRISDEEAMRGYPFISHLFGEGRERTSADPASCRKAAEIAERYADGLAKIEELKAAKRASRDWVSVGDFYAETKPTVIGRDETEYELLAVGVAAQASQAACSDVDYLGHVPRYTAEAAAFLNCKPTDPLPEPSLDPAERKFQAALFRDIFGNPFRPVAFDSAWRTDTALTLARQMYESRDFSAMPILADALQDAGCDNDDILNHCRDLHATHVRGCWVVDLVLGKETE